MPSLRSIAILTRKQVVHGLSFGTVKMILSIPQVREVSITGLLLSPSKLPDDDYYLDSFSPITSFHYEVFSNRFAAMKTRQNYPFPSEKELLHLVLGRIHTSLQKLVLSAFRSSQRLSSPCRNGTRPTYANSVSVASDSHTPPFRT